ncbi:MAG TPA: protealysin inhibitor emfourin [Pseudolabrys sp.]|nr:protealysin inhibitor emfourin [Pseudolabrys sp.]
MKVTLSKHGGQAAGINLQRPPLVVDSAALDDSGASELKKLAASAISAAVPAHSGRARDEMSYTITIEDDGRETELSQSDTAMSAEFGRLLAWLQRRPGK